MSVELEILIDQVAEKVCQSCDFYKGIVNEQACSRTAEFFVGQTVQAFSQVKEGAGAPDEEPCELTVADDEIVHTTKGAVIEAFQESTLRLNQEATRCSAARSRAFLLNRSHEGFVPVTLYSKPELLKLMTPKVA